MVDKINIAILAIFCLLNITFFTYYFSDFTQKIGYKLNTNDDNYEIDSEAINNVTYTYNIFFVETNADREYLTPTQICGIESAALKNPLALVQVFSFKAKLNQKWLDTYSNIKIIQLDDENLNDLLNGTSFENWYDLNEEQINKSVNKYKILSEMIRIVLLWKYGGYYSDFDTITIKSVEPFLTYDAAIGLQQDDPVEINFSNLFFIKNHTFLAKWMELSVSKNFDPNSCCLLESKNIEKLCNLKINKIPIIEMEISLNNETNPINIPCDIELISSKYFSPFNRDLSEKYFYVNSKIDILRFIETYSIHFFSTNSVKSKIFFRSNTIYEFYAKNNCPIYYNDYIIEEKN